MMHRKATPLALALTALVLYAGRDALVRPVTSHIGGIDPEISGWVAPGRPVPPGEVGVYKAPPAPAREPVRGTIGRNSSLYVELRKLGVSAFDIEELTSDTRRTFDWRRVRPGQNFDLYPADDGGVDSLLLYTGIADYVRVCRNDDGYAAALAQIPYEVTYHVTHGTISNSVYASLQELGAETELASSLDEIFGWTIDLAKDLRDGDEYVLLYETREYETGYSAVGDVLAARIVNSGHEYDAVRFKPGSAPAAYYDLAGMSLQKSMRRAPLKFTHVSSSFSHRRFHPIQHVYKPHYGTDYAAPKGTPIYATGDGVIVAAQYTSGNGNYVKIHHNKEIETYYLHMSGFAKGIRRGVRVTEGQLIGYVGMTGWATAPHVCYRVTRNGVWVNSRTLELPSMKPVAPALIAQFDSVRDAYMSRIHEALMDGLDNRTMVVEAPDQPTPLLRASLF
jgi:murein DD-endopeptidase MepM/ murein hydrolase activator NlpD